MKTYFRDKGLGWYILSGAAFLALVLAIVVFATWDTAMPNVVADGYIVGIVLLVAVALHLVFSFVSVRFAAIPAVALYMVTFGLVLMRIAATVADEFNNVHYQGGDFGTCIAYAVLTLVCAVAALAACFFPQRKEEKYLV